MKLPPEIWLKIFHLVIAKDGVLPFLMRYITIEPFDFIPSSEFNAYL